MDFYSHPGYIGHKVHLLVAYDLEWDPLEMEDGEEIRVHTFTLDEALEATKVKYRCDSEAALAPQEIDHAPTLEDRWNIGVILKRR